MTLPMVTCPLCCRPGFSSSDSLCTALIDVTTRKLSCPICNHEVLGLDKFTIHLFSHSLSRFGYLKTRETAKINHTETNRTYYENKNDNTVSEMEQFQNKYCSTDKLENNSNEEVNKPLEKQDTWDCNNYPVKCTKSVFNDASLIYFRTDNGQIFALSHENLGSNLKNVTINTQNYITSTNITTSTLQTNLIGNVQKRKYCQTFDKDTSLTKTRGLDLEGSPEMYTNGESIPSYPSTPSVSSETDKFASSSNTTEREFESCRELLTKGDFSTNGDDLSDLEITDTNEANKNAEMHSAVDKETEDKAKESNACELCSYVFPNKTILAMHNQLIHKKVETEVESKRKLLLCNLCPRTFSLRSSLMIHRRVAHAGGFGSSENAATSKQITQNLSCQVCGKVFSKDVHLSQHMKVHDEKQWQCNICEKAFTTKYFLKKHRRLHTGEMPYRCKTCSKSFTFQQTYRKHLLYHNNDKPYCCAQCGRLFKELSTLHNHERIHSGEKPFTCETCDMSVCGVTNTHLASLFVCY
uniref:C2H2-type domain-containing protein n=1 Tax=Panstrongylus lignarius TaxID=156445 RepID=A0A224XN83_9HEMI